MVTPLLTFVADVVETETTEYTPDFVVDTMYFGFGDPEADGHGWSFSRSLDDDWGVCTVREIQLATIYEGIESFQLRPDGIECVFDPEGAADVGFLKLEIMFAIDDQTWQELLAAAMSIFRNRSYFQLDEKLNHD